MTDVPLKALDLKLGKRVDQGGLDAIPRAISRQSLQPPARMKGFDLWNAYETSFLLPSGKPVVLHLLAAYAADTQAIVESKSFKLYLNSMNHQVFPRLENFQSTVSQDLENVVGGRVELTCFLPDQSPQSQPLPGLWLDTLTPRNIPKNYQPEILEWESGNGTFCFHSHLLRTQCPITNQPDWGSVVIKGEGPRQPLQAPLLAYLISFRNRPDFHETCCEAIFTDLYRLLQPDSLTVACRYTRRGGLDINPVRTTMVDYPRKFTPSWRQ